MSPTREIFAEPVEAYVTRRVPIAAPQDRAREARQAIVGGELDVVDEVAVLEGERLVGIVSVAQLLQTPAETPLAELMDREPAVLDPGGSEEAAAWRMVRRGQRNLAVAGPRGSFAGLVPADRMIGRLLTEHDEDAARLGGYLASSGRARLAAEEPVSRRILHRLPWLLVGLVGAMASAVLVGSFEAQLDAKVLLAFFVPAVVYMADAVGTQTETLLIRGMSADIDMKRVVRREIVTGALIGAMIGVVFFGFALIGWGDRDVALAVALALFASCAIATSIATILPRLLARLGSDPAFGSGPLATIVQDLLSIAVYLGIVTVVAT